MPPLPDPPPAVRTGAAFPLTQWSQVLCLNDANEETQAAALGAICQAYWFPLYAFARHRGMQPQDAEDAVQGFFLSRGDVGFFQKANAEKGKLRTFILTAFTRHLKDGLTRQNAQKRGGGAPMLSIDHDQVEDWLLADPRSADDSGVLNFERHWARNLLRTAIATLAKAAGNSKEAQRRWTVLSPFLNPETCHQHTIRSAAAELGVSENGCTKAVHQLRQALRIAVREQVAATLENPTEATVLQEMQQLQLALAT